MVPENHKAFYYGALRACINNAAYCLQSAQATAQELGETTALKNIRDVMDRLQREIRQLDTHTLQKDYRG